MINGKHGQGTHSTKTAENIPNAPKCICPNCLSKPKSLGFRWKKASLGVRSPWSTRTYNNTISWVSWDILKKRTYVLYIVCVLKISFSKKRGWSGAMKEEGCQFEKRGNILWVKRSTFHSLAWLGLWSINFGYSKLG